MKKFFSNFLKELKELSWVNFLALFIAGIINSVGVTMFLQPVSLYDSGISGTSMFLDQITPEFLTLSLFLVLLNVPIFIFGFKKQGACFTVYSLSDCFWNAGDDDGICNGTGSAGKSCEDVS